MMYLVEKAFVDKETKRHHDEGSLYLTDNKERAEELRRGGFLGAELVVKEELPKQTNDKDEDPLKEPSEKEVKEPSPKQENKKK